MAPCAYCGGPRTIPDGPVGRHVYELDPYCTRICCELDRGLRAPDEKLAGSRTSS